LDGVGKDIVGALELPSLMSPSKIEKAMSEAFIAAISGAILGWSFALA
jgi:hypothetical protein